MRSVASWMALVAVSVMSVASLHASLIGPWFRYQSSELGFEIPVATGWRVISVPNGVVFAMQYAPQPYVRVAIGRLAGSPEPLASDSPHPMACQIDGQKGFKIEGKGPHGPFMNVFVKKGDYTYWIGFTADRADQWTEYARTFQIILDGFHFV